MTVFLVENWFDGYIKSYLERDVRDISHIHSLSDYQRVLSLSSFRVGGLLSYTELAKDCGIGLMTTKRYLNLLFISYLISPIAAILQEHWKEVC